jgi:DNA-directed RNA polymerase specialized sigma subunit
MERVSHVDFEGGVAPAFSTDELLQECAIGLLQAAHKYEDSVGLDWPMLAALFINGQVWNCLRDRGVLLRRPENVARCGEDIDQSIQLLMTSLGHYPVDDEIAGDLGASIEGLRDDLLTCLVYRVAKEYWEFR